MSPASTPAAAKRVFISVPLPEWARRFSARVEEVLFHYARPFHFAMCFGQRGSEMAFEEKPGFWVRTTDAPIGLPTDCHIVLVDAAAARALCAQFMDKLLAENPREWKRVERWFWAQAPYCYARRKDGSLLALNRGYAPLGAGPKFGSYEEFAGQAERFTCDPRAMEGVWTHVHEDGARAYLYNDDPGSRAGYFSRLLKLDEYIELPGETAAPPR